MTFDPDMMIAAYLDGALARPDREAFEQEMLRRPELRAEVERQRRIDDALKRLFEPPPASRFLERLNAVRGPSAATAGGTGKATGTGEAGGGGAARGGGEAARHGGDGSPGVGGADIEARHAAPERPAAPVAGAAPRPLRLWLRRPWAVAAVLILGAVGVWRVWSFGRLNIADLVGAIQPDTLVSVYHTQVEVKHMQPVWVCKDDREIADTLRSHFGQALALGQLPAGLQTIGWSYGHSLSPHTLYLLARVEGHPVIVCIDRQDAADPAFDTNIPWWSGLRVFERRIGDLVAYEITPLGLERVIPLLHEPAGGGAEAGPRPSP